MLLDVSFLLDAIKSKELLLLTLFTKLEDDVSATVVVAARSDSLARPEADTEVAELAVLELIWNDLEMLSNLDDS